MKFDVLGDLNWLAVVVATIAYFALGALWYSPVLFQKPWVRAAGMPEPAEGQQPGAAIYLSPLIHSFIATIATAMVAASTGSATFADGLVLGIVLGIAFGFSIIFVTATFETSKPEKWLWAGITGGYHFVGLVIAAVIVSIWD